MLLSAVGIAPAGKSNECSPLCTGVDHLCNEVQLHFLLCSCASLYLSGHERDSRCAIVTFAVCPRPGSWSRFRSCSCGRCSPNGVQTKMFSSPKGSADQDVQLGDVPALVLGALPSPAASSLSIEAALCKQEDPAPRMFGVLDGCLDAQSIWLLFRDLVAGKVVEVSLAEQV